MNALDKIILKSFLAALLRLDHSLPEDVQRQVNDISKDLNADSAKLSSVVRKYLPLQQPYKDVRLVLQTDGERFQSSALEENNLINISDEKLLQFAFNILNAEDSVYFMKNTYAESSDFRQIFSLLQPQENVTRISILDLIGKYCMSVENGQIVYYLIYPKLLANQPVNLDFTGVDICTSPFLSIAIGQLLKDISPEKLDHLLTVSNLNTVWEQTRQQVMETCKQYYADPEFRSRVDKVRYELLNSL